MSSTQARLAQSQAAFASHFSTEEKILSARLNWKTIVVVIVIGVVA
jgi:hypothetical protein